MQPSINQIADNALSTDRQTAQQPEGNADPALLND